MNLQAMCLFPCIIYFSKLPNQQTIYVLEYIGIEQLTIIIVYIMGPIKFSTNSTKFKKMIYWMDFNKLPPITLTVCIIMAHDANMLMC